MSSITIRNLDDRVKRKLRVRAARHGRSMEEEVRQILGAAVAQTSAPAQPDNIYDVVRRRFEPLGDVELYIPPRSKRMREPPSFE
jgi:plasmid stability protein